MVQLTQSDQVAGLNTFGDALSVIGNIHSASQSYLAGMARYTADFLIPYQLSCHYFYRTESKRLLKAPLGDSFEAYLGLLDNNLELINRSTSGTFEMMIAFTRLVMPDCYEAMGESYFRGDHHKLARFTERQARLFNHVAQSYPQAIIDIEPEFGFHFESGTHPLVDETDRFVLYQVAPSTPGVEIRTDAKPLLILPPYVLGANILGFLPKEQRSYAHCYANQGFPTYIRVLKDIESSAALQVMTGEDDAKDTRRFCEAIAKAHGKPVTLNGYCQGGFSGLCDLLSGELDDLVDAFITCVSPMDGTRSRGLAHFLNRLPTRFNDLAYGTKELANGNTVADGKLMGWVYKLKSIEHEIPAAAFFRDLMMFARQDSDNYTISKTAAALNYWLQNERFDLPLEITKMSFASYNKPISDDGTLPVRLFGKKLNLKRLRDKKIPWLICYGEHDDLVEKATALAPLDYIEAETSPFPKGHVAIATSWSHPDSSCALHTRYGDGRYRGPVLFHTDLDKALSEESAAATRKRSAKGASIPSKNENHKRNRKRRTHQKQL
ncbi:MAG: metal transporter [Desulfofustis sp.]|nr:metal transporter [Desulfofustis sp.]